MNLPYLTFLVSSLHLQDEFEQFKKVFETEAPDHVLQQAKKGPNSFFAAAQMSLTGALEFVRQGHQLRQALIEELRFRLASVDSGGVEVSLHESKSSHE